MMLNFNNSSTTNSTNTTTPPQGGHLAYLGLFFIPIATIWGNILVCLAVRIEKRLQNRFNYFLVSLAMSDLLSAVLVMPVSAYKMVTGDEVTVSRIFCLMWYSLDVFFTASTIIHLCTISADRYFALKDPLKYHSTKRRSSLIIKIFIAWLVPFCIACPLFIFATKQADNTDNEDKSFKGCGPDNAYFTITATVVTFVLPLIIMVVTYFLTIHTIIRQTKRAQAHLHGRHVFKSVSTSYSRDCAASAIEQPSEIHSELHLSQSSSGETNNPQDDRKTSVSSTTRRTINKTNFAGILRYGSKYLSKHKRNLSSPATPMLSKDANHIAMSELSLASDSSSAKRQRVQSLDQEKIYRDSIISIPGNSTYSNELASQSKASTTTGNNTKRFLSVPGQLSDENLVQKITRKFSTCSWGFGGAAQARSKSKKVMNYIHKGKKAVQVLGILFMLFLLCYLPFFVTLLVDFSCVECKKYTIDLIPKMEWIGYAASMLNPIVYHIFNPHFRTTFHRIMKCNCKKMKFIPHSGSPYT